MPSRNRLMQLLRDNAKAEARQPFRAEQAGEEATLYLYDAIVDVQDDWWGGVGADVFTKELRAITAPVIHLRINSPGGDVFAARAIEQAIREHPARCIAHIDGCAASAASFVALAADEVEIAPGAFFMIHKAWTLSYGNSDDLKATAALLDKIDQSLAQTYAAETGQSVGDCLAWMVAETWLMGQEAVDLGFADRLAEDAPKASAAWNLSAYAKAPVVAAAVPAPASVVDMDEIRRRLALVDILGR